CTQLLECTPQVVTPNGFEPDFLPGKRIYAQQRKAGRERLLRIASFLTGEKYTDDTFIIATSGRNEYRNKGLDLYIDAVEAAGSACLRENGKILALILVPAWVKEPAGELLIDLNHGGADRPEVSYLTHRLNNEGEDSICRRLAQIQADSRQSNTRIIFVPCYLDGHDGIVDIAYYDLLPALDMTVFASYYEPWGYTPLESVAFGVPTITTDKAGFGQWVLSNFKNSLCATGAFVTPRNDSNYTESTNVIASQIAEYMALPAAQIKSARQAAADTARKADWQFFIKDYEKAFDIALTNAAMRQ
ncbi:MAG: glycosyltransferase, partial [Muribaculaceae bacterium]|nr:glycosyltransferase [Muribaculaceae bacterium]